MKGEKNKKLNKIKNEKKTVRGKKVCKKVGNAGKSNPG